MSEIVQIKKRKRFQKPDLGTDRSDAYNKIHDTQIANNHMLDRYLRNKADLERMGVATWKKK